MTFQIVVNHAGRSHVVQIYLRRFFRQDVVECKRSMFLAVRARRSESWTLATQRSSVNVHGDFGRRVERGMQDGLAESRWYRGVIWIRRANTKYCVRSAVFAL